MLESMKKSLVLSIVAIGVMLSVSGCGFIKGWKTDYGRAEAHIEDVDLAEEGETFVGKKVLVRGEVKKVDFSEKGNPKVLLSYGTECHFGRMEEMAKAIKVGRIVVISGILDEEQDGKLFLSPAILRDPKAPFNP